MSEETKVIKCKPPYWGMILATVLVVFIVIYVGVLARNALKNYDYIGKSAEFPHTISISGEGKVFTKPDIATTSVGIRTEKSSVIEAQKENTQKMNDLIKVIKGLGVEDKDIQTTNYNIYPQYDWTSGRSKLRGYEVSQSVTIKIRKLDKIGDILEAAGQGGANQVSGISFSVDEPEKLKQEARIKAIANAKEKADALAEASGVKLGKIVSFSESGNQGAPIYRDKMTYLGEGGLGAAPTIEAGSYDIVIYATISYEIL